jgi:hypothetical protein
VDHTAGLDIVPKIVCPVQTVKAAFEQEGFETLSASCLSEEDQIFSRACVFIKIMRHPTQHSTVN